jgi:hypothetical protein
LRAPTKSYLAITFGPLIGVAHWVVEEFAREQPWWHSIPFVWLIAMWGAFMLGLIAQDIANHDSWIRGNLRSSQRLMVLERVVPAYRTSLEREWLEITAWIKFVRTVENVHLIVRVDANMNMTHAREQFVLRNESYGRVAADESKQFVVAIVPLKRHDGEPLGYQCWGDHFRESGDTERMRTLSAGTRNIVEIQARGGFWFRQSEHFLLAVTDAPGTGTSGGVYIDVDGEVRNPIIPAEASTPISQLAQQHWLETYKSLISLAIEGFKFSALANGGAAVALLAYLGNLAGKSTQVADMRAPMAAFLGGLITLGIAMVLAYLTQLQLLNEAGNSQAAGRHASILRGTILLFLASLGAFAVGCWQAVKRF